MRRPYKAGVRSVGSRPSDKDGGGGGHSNSEIRGGGVKKIFFSVLSKNKGWVGGGLGPSGSFPESATAL